MLDVSIRLSAEIDLSERVKELYASFSSYSPPTKLDASPLRDPAKILAALNSAPLAELGEEALGPFAVYALTTVGEVSDYKYYLPRILVISTISNSCVGFDPVVIAGKLRLAEWVKWPLNERSAIASFIYSAWAYERLQAASLRNSCWNWIAAMALLNLQFEACLHLWTVLPTPDAMLQLAEGVTEIKHLRKGKGRWEDVSAVSREAILQWIASTEVETALIESIDAIEDEERWKIETMLDEVEDLRRLVFSASR